MKKFYDIHMHAFNLSHPNILAFISRINWRIMLMTTPVSAPVMSLFGWDTKIKNMLTMLENDLGNYFLVLEYYLRQSPFIRHNYIGYGSEAMWTNQYHKIVICPLIMDFGYKNILSNSFYRVPAQKPIVEQTRDLMAGIDFYNRNTLRVISDGEKKPLKTSYEPAEKSDKLFEIYPFLGLNTTNYTLKSIVSILDEYFADYDGKLQTLYENMGGRAGFAGIKLYPPLGFDPWPDDPAEREKVEYLYSYCTKKQIPITTHCSDGGFAVTDMAEEFTNPARWRKVLQEYPELKINFAHMGKQSKKKFILFSQSAWAKEVIMLIAQFPNAYADFSCTAFDNKYYRELARTIEEYPQIREKVLFGTDFMVNLLWCDSYNSYLETFCRTEHLSRTDKDLLCSVNSERFLFR